MNLDELRKINKISQENLAKLLDTTQANISRIERRKNIHVSTLRKYIEAVGGELWILAHFSKENKNIFIKQFENISIVKKRGRPKAEKATVKKVMGKRRGRPRKLTAKE